MHVCDKSLQSCPTLCDTMDCGPPGSFVHGDSPGQRILEWGAMPSSGFFTTSITWEAQDLWDSLKKPLKNLGDIMSQMFKATEKIKSFYHFRSIS